jgi:phage terminase large subunit-like protein
VTRPSHITGNLRDGESSLRPPRSIMEHADTAVRGPNFMPQRVLLTNRRQAKRVRPDPAKMPWNAPGLTRAGRVIAFCETLRVTSGADTGKSLQLRPWQKDFIEAVYREAGDGKRPVRTAILTMGRKNGKTQLAAALALCHLCGPESEDRGEIYSCANDRFQAAKLYAEMVAMIERQPLIGWRLATSRFHKSIEDLETDSCYLALSREARTKMGLNPSFVVYDELGQTEDRSLYDAMDSAMGARKNPLLLVISTQAADDNAPMSRLVDYGHRVAAGDITDPAFHLTCYAAPNDADPWSRATWALANPALGDFRSLEDVERLASQAQRMPTQEASFRNLILNQRIAAETRFIERTEWKACAGAATIPDGAGCFGGLDLGATRDLSALVLIHEDVAGVFHVQPHFWLPGDVRARAEEDKVPYDVWVRDGMITPIGATTDPRVVARKIAELDGRYRIKAIAYDRWRINDLKRELDAIGCRVTVVAHGQGYKEMSPAVDVLERMVAQHRLRHGGHPVLTWNAFNAVVTRDPAGGRKLDKVRSIGRIDGLVALAMALSQTRAEATRAFDAMAMIG